MKRTGITNKPAQVKMSSTAVTAAAPPTATSLAPALTPAPRVRKEHHPLWRALELAASLRITAWLFVLSFVLVWFGTWAQKDASVWTVVATYFRSAIVFIPLHVILLYNIEPVNFWVPYPGGWLLGGLLLVNLIAAHVVRFKVSWKRSGILLIHSGLVMMMLGELVAGLYQVEGRMRIREGSSSNYVEIDRVGELAVIDRQAKEDVVVSVPMSHLGRAASASDYVSHADLPFDIEVLEFMSNSVQDKKRKDSLADQGFGRSYVVVPIAETSGTSTNQMIELPSAYVTFRDKRTNASLGTYLVSYHFWLLEQAPQRVEVDGKTYHVELRPKRSYRDFQLKLIDFRFDRYEGTRQARNYQSDVVLIDPVNKENRKVTISMNNPLRYGGETFYQASFSEDETATVLQVVRNPGWLMPYIACVVVTLGMLVHFGLTLVSFLQKRMAQ